MQDFKKISRNKGVLEAAVVNSLTLYGKIKY